MALYNSVLTLTFTKNLESLGFRLRVKIANYDGSRQITSWSLCSYLVLQN